MYPNIGVILTAGAGMSGKSVVLEPNRAFSVSEVAAVTEVEPKIVNRFIDDRVLPAYTYRRKNNDRAVYSFACPIVDFYSSEAGSSLTKDTRREVADWLSEHLKSSWNAIFTIELLNDFENWSSEYATLMEDQRTFLDVAAIFEPDALKFNKGALALDLSESVNRSLVCLLKLRLAENLMVEDPDIRGGITTIRGTRISPYEAAGMALADGIESAMEDYPSLSRDAFELAILYARANPLRGRPKRQDDDWRKDWRLVSRAIVPMGELEVQGAK